MALLWRFLGESPSRLCERRNCDGTCAFNLSCVTLDIAYNNHDKLVQYKSTKHAKYTTHFLNLEQTSNLAARSLLSGSTGKERS